MLLFIYILFGTLCTTAPVSIHLMLLFISKHFHIYQIFYKFQYISCYSLSCFSRRSVIFHIPFQYISCYSLSGGHFVYFSVYLCFNTSHVTLYLLRREYKKRGAERFNTSHVTLYPDCYGGFHHAGAVSIHLMLLFITSPIFLPWYSCVVSIHLMLLFIVVTEVFTSVQKHRFNTSHVTLYHLLASLLLPVPPVSIHLMLLFIYQSRFYNL